MAKKKDKKASRKAISVPAHGAPGAFGPKVVPAAPVLVEAASTTTRKLDLGCGQNPKEGYEGVDIAGGKAQHIVDLFKFPFPFADNSVDELHASHFLEHIPAREIENRDLHMPAGSISTDIAARRSQFIGQDMLFAFMDECFRILKPEGWFHIVVPSGRSHRAFQDPTHRRFFMQETFLYFNAGWRQANGLDHYRVKCDFHIPGDGLTHTLTQEESLYSQEALLARSKHYWNTTIDWVAKLKKSTPS